MLLSFANWVLCDSKPKSRDSGAAPFKHVHCGVHAADYRLINPGRVSFSCVGRGQLVPCQLNIYSLCNTIFGAQPTSGNDEAAAAAARRLSQQRSILDTVAKDLEALQGRLGPKERDKVAIHLDAVRDSEKRLTTMISTVMPSQTGVPTTGQGNEANADKLFRLLRVLLRLTRRPSATSRRKTSRQAQRLDCTFLRLGGMLAAVRRVQQTPRLTIDKRRLMRMLHERGRGRRPDLSGDWIEHCRAFWTEQVDRLGKLPERMDE